jgi:hypothetical protein
LATLDDKIGKSLASQQVRTDSPGRAHKIAEFHGLRFAFDADAEVATHSVGTADFEKSVRAIAD